MTKAHNDRIITDGSNKGYSIRIGKTLPANSANLAYVSTPKISPAKNLQILDLSSNIKENGLPSTYEVEKIMYPDDDFLLRELTGESQLPSRKATITDEFSIPANTQEAPTPLYFRAAIKGWFDARGAMVTPYVGGYYEKPPESVVDYARVSGDEKDNLLYLGNKIKITNLDGTPIKSEYKYKIQLVSEEGEGIPQNAYSIYIYTNFRGSKNETFAVRYEKYNEDTSHTSDYVEILNAYPFFSQVDKFYLDEIASQPKANGEWRSELREKKYSVTEATNDTYQLHAPSQVLVANNATRPAHQFKYRMRGNLKTRLSIGNEGTMKVGMAFLNTSIPNVEDLTGIFKKINESPYRPLYLQFENPYPMQLSFTKDNPRYWMVDLYMPVEKWHEYDLIILTGYGFYDMSPFSDSIRSYLENGGKIWVDNAGEAGKVLSFTAQSGKETFVTNVGFSNGTSVSGLKANANTVESNEILNRLYTLEQTNLSTFGYAGVNPQITFGSGESLTNWTKVIRYSNNEPSVVYRNLYERGTLIVSNCGIFRSIVQNKPDPLEIRFVMNQLLLAVENKWIQGPWQHDYVYHRDNLFKKEYVGVGGTTIYVDERNDYDSSQIVAKKIISKTTRGAILPYLPSSHFTAKGTFEVEMQSDAAIILNNGNVEIGTFDGGAGTAVTSWNTSTSGAIPGWDTVHLAGASTLFSHIDDASQRGEKAIQIETPIEDTGSHSFWRNKTSVLLKGSYRGTVWMKVSNVDARGGSGATLGVYTLAGEVISKGAPILGTRDWVKIDVDFTLADSQEVELRAGFVDGNSVGTVTIDYLTLSQIGSVYMTPANDGNKPLYAYAVRPRGESFDLRAQGFSSADVTTYDPEIEMTYTIRAFVYYWENSIGRYAKKYGNSVTTSRKIRRSDGVVNLGSLSTMLPPLSGGPDWADKNGVYYEIYLGSSNGLDSDSQFVNLEIYNKDTGKYSYTKHGELIIRYLDLMYMEENRNILLQARTNYYTVRATKRRYGVLVEAEDKIELAYPSTIDNRDRWYLRVRNGSFIKNELSYNDIKSLLSYDSRYYEFQQRLFGTHVYSLPEYNRQVFKPSIGIKRIRQEAVEYVNDNTVRVQDAPLYIQEGEVRKELLAKVDTDGRMFKAINSEWSKAFAPRVYVDENMNGVEVEWLEGFDIDFIHGLIVFHQPISGTVKVDYNYDNLEVWKRTYNNVRIRDEELSSSDRRSFMSLNKNWLRYPTPIIKVRTYEGDVENIVPVSSYTIDYSAGLVTFKEDVGDRVIADYTHCNDKPLKVRDYDARSGYIYLEDEVDFRDEIYANYHYEENFLEYRGYYDQQVESFIHLDLNPSEGHYCTMPVVRIDEAGEASTSWERVPTAKLINKEVYVYILPYKDSFGNYNEHAVRHCYSLVEWQSIQKTNPAAMLLGIVLLREHAAIQDAVVMDARKRGGGLKESISQTEMKQVEPLSQNYWDMSTWDGTAYYKNGVIVIELPKKILDSEGGQFNEQQVRDIISKYIAYGIYFIIEFV